MLKYSNWSSPANSCFSSVHIRFYDYHLCKLRTLCLKNLLFTGGRVTLVTSQCQLSVRLLTCQPSRLVWLNVLKGTVCTQWTVYTLQYWTDIKLKRIVKSTLCIIYNIHIDCIVCTKQYFLLAALRRLSSVYMKFFSVFENQ